MRFIVLLFLMLSVSVPAYSADPWSEEDKIREAVYLTFHAVDWGQTLDIAKNPNLYEEGNPILGEHPSVRRVNTYFAATALLHIGAVHVLPARWRPAFQYLWIGAEAGTVTRNHRAGVRVNF